MIAFKPKSDGECVMCDRALAVFGILVGLVFIYISVDILTDGRITSALSPGGTRLFVSEVSDDTADD
jgi:hypothetical protein